MHRSLAKLFAYALSVLVLALFTTPVNAATFNVTTAAELQTALDAAAINSQDDTINIAAGTYNTSDNSGSSFSYISSEANSLTIVGADTATTILDGGDADQVLYIISSTSTAITVSISGLTLQDGLISGDSGAGLNISLSASVGSTVDLSDLIIQSSATAAHSGGGAYVYSLGNISLSNLTIDSNIAGSGATSGGGMTVVTTAGDITATGLTVSQNSASTLSNGGGGCYFESATGNISVSDSTFSQNSISVTGYGGGLAINVMGGEATLSNVTATDNSTVGNGGGVMIFADGNITVANFTATGNTGSASDGGAGYFESTNGGTVSVSDSTLSNNNAKYGAGLELRSLATGGAVTLSNSDFTSNSASDTGGALYVYALSVTGTNNSFISNSSATDGGAIFFVSQGTLSANLFDSNTTSDDGGAIFASLGSADTLNVLNNIFVNNTAGDQGGAISSLVPTGNTFNLVNNSIVDNSAAVGGGLVLSATASTANIYNNIIYGNTASSASSGEDIFFILVSSPTVSLFNNDFVEACFSGASCDPVTELGSNQGDNLSADPLFADAASGNYTLQGTSSLIDAGSGSAPALPSTDYSGNPRDFGLAPDMGAYEAIPSSGTSTTSVTFNADGSQTITITNTGNYPLSVSALTLSDTTNFSLDTSAGDQPCGDPIFSVDPGSSCTFNVVFTGESSANISSLVSAAESVSATLTITTDDPANSSITINLSGTVEGGGSSSSSSTGCAMSNNGSVQLLHGLMFGILLLFLLRVQKKTFG